MASKKGIVLSLDSGEEGSEFSGFEPLQDDVAAKQVSVSNSSESVGVNKQDKRKVKATA